VSALLSDYVLWKLAHVLLLVYWLGADLAVYYTSRHVCDASSSVPARLVALKIMLFVDLLPRFALVLMLPVGLSLAASANWITLHSPALAFIWLIGVGWLALVWSIHHWQGRALTTTLTRFDFALRIVVILALLTLIAVDATDRVQVFNAAPWLGLKLGLFALCVFAGLMIRLALKPFAPAFAEIAKNGSQPGPEAALKRSIAKVKPWVFLIWIALIAAAWIGLAKPYF
jgi:hypothetical protein